MTLSPQWLLVFYLCLFDFFSSFWKLHQIASSTYPSPHSSSTTCPSLHMYCLNFNSPLKKQEKDWNTVSVSVIVTSDVTMDISVSWWPGSLKTVPEVFAKVNSVQFLAPFWSGDLGLGALPCCLSKHVFNHYFLENTEIGRNLKD